MSNSGPSFAVFCMISVCLVFSLESEALGDLIRNAISPNHSKYDSNKIPCSPRPLTMSVNIFIESLRDITSQCVMDFYLRQNWQDCTIADILAVENGESTAESPGFKTSDFTSFNAHDQSIWLPDSYFYKVREAQFGLGSKEHFIRVDAFGGVLLSQKVKLVTPCEINVAYFPFDVTHCTVVIASYGHTEASLRYSWHEKGVMLYPSNLDDNGFLYLYAHLTSRTDEYDVGNFSVIEAQLFFERRYDVFFVQVYIPAALIVLLSWIGFYIQRNATPARASIGITTVLTMLTLASESSNKYDKNICNTINAINIYVWVCFAFVILAMVEFALADYFNKPRYTNRSHEHDTTTTPTAKLTPKATPKNSDNPRLIFQGTKKTSHSSLFPTIPDISVTEQDPLNGATPPTNSRRFRTRKLTLASIAHSIREMKETEVPRTVDKVSRYLFPITFLLFNITYGIYYAISIRVYRSQLSRQIQHSSTLF